MGGRWGKREGSGRRGKGEVSEGGGRGGAVSGGRAGAVSERRAGTVSERRAGGKRAVSVSGWVVLVPGEREGFLGVHRGSLACASRLIGFSSLAT